jgi:peptidoglycan/LPS O-acetylase OafA/YrhL
VGFFEGLGVFNLIQFGKLVLLIAVFICFEKYLNKKNRLLGYLAEISFGLFFIHGFYMALYARINPAAGSVMQGFGEFMLVILGSIITVYLTKALLRKRSRYVIGC